MKRLHPTLSYLFVCLPTLDFTTFEQQACSPKINYANALKLGTNSCKKRNVVTMNTLTVIGLNDIRTLYIGSSKSSESLFGICAKLKDSIFKNNNQIKSTFTTRTCVFSTGWIRTFSSARLVFEWENGGSPRFIKWLMLFFEMRRSCIILTKMKVMIFFIYYLLYL